MVLDDVLVEFLALCLVTGSRQRYRRKFHPTPTRPGHVAPRKQHDAMPSSVLQDLHMELCSLISFIAHV
jgi:hypothetical protein